MTTAAAWGAKLDEMERKVVEIRTVGIVRGTAPLFRRLSRTDCVCVTARHVRRTLSLLDQGRPADRAAVLTVDLCEELGRIEQVPHGNRDMTAAFQGALWQVGAPRAGLLGLGVLALLRATAAGTAKVRAADAGQALQYSTDAFAFAAWADAVGYPPEKDPSQMSAADRTRIPHHPAFRVPMVALWMEVFRELRDLAPR